MLFAYYQIFSPPHFLPLLILKLATLLQGTSNYLHSVIVIQRR